jgi:uracil permease
MLKFESIHFELPAMALAAISGVLLNAFLPKKEK